MEKLDFIHFIIKMKKKNFEMKSAGEEVNQKKKEKKIK